MKKFNTTYTGDRLMHIAFPLGGIGAGMFCIQGSGMLGNFSIRNTPDIHLEPNVFSAICVKGKEENTARVLEGQVPYHKIFGHPTVGELGIMGMGNGLHGKNYGLPRFNDNDFSSRFPFAAVNFYDETVPLDINVTAWSPFIPLNEDDSSLPAAFLEYQFVNNTGMKIESVYSFNAQNFLAIGKKNVTAPDGNEAKAYKYKNGFILHQPESENLAYAKSWFMAAVDEEAFVNTDWYDGGWFDKLTMLWKNIEDARLINAHNMDNKSPGGTIAVPFTLNPGENKTISLKLAWYSPNSNLRKGNDDPDNCSSGCCSDKENYNPWYSAKFDSVEAVMNYVTWDYKRLKTETAAFTDALFSSTLPPEIIDAVMSNLSILKSPTILRQTDGRMWAWEGCCDTNGCCSGSCTHVWNYAQAICHLFPVLERSLRQTEFNESQNEEGHQAFRSSLPIRPAAHDFHAASDGQLGGIMKVYREWRIYGNTKWMSSYWDKVKASLDYCIKTWDRKHEGVLTEPHHNTYDIEFWGADAMCSSFYLGALKAACLMGKELKKDISEYKELYKKGRDYVETQLFNGEYFYQETEWKNLENKLDLTNENEQCRDLIEKEGPKYQYGTGCISDGVLGAWMAKVCGLGDILDPEKVRSHLLSVYKYNFRKSLVNHANPQRPGYALGNEGGLLLCTWPQGGKPSLPFPYSDEVWTGIEYQVASHLMMFGEIEKGLEIVRIARARYDGRKRNPYDEYECGHWYARALSSYALIEGFTGIRYDEVDKTLYIKKDIPEGTKSFLATESGYGLIIKNLNKIHIETIAGNINVRSIIYI